MRHALPDEVAVKAITCATYLGMPPIFSLLNHSAVILSRVRGWQRRCLRLLHLGAGAGILDTRPRRRGQCHIGCYASSIGNPSLKFLPHFVNMVPGPQTARRGLVSILPFDDQVSPQVRPYWPPRTLDRSHITRVVVPPVCTHKSDSVMSRIVSHVSKPWSRKTSRYCEMPSSPNTSCNFGDMQNMDHSLGIERIGHDQRLVGPVLSVHEASPEAKNKKSCRRARF